MHAFCFLLDYLYSLVCVSHPLCYSGRLRVYSCVKTHYATVFQYLCSCISMCVRGLNIWILWANLPDIILSKINWLSWQRPRRKRHYSHTQLTGGPASIIPLIRCSSKSLQNWLKLYKSFYCSIYDRVALSSSTNISACFTFFSRVFFFVFWLFRFYVSFSNILLYAFFSGNSL